MWLKFCIVQDAVVAHVNSLIETRLESNFALYELAGVYLAVPEYFWIQ